MPCFEGKTVGDVVAEWQERYRLTAAETEILAFAVTESAEHQVIADARGVRAMTIKTQASYICKKTKSSSLADAALRLLRERLFGCLEEEAEEGIHGPEGQGREEG